MASCNFIIDELLHKKFSRILIKWTPSNGYFSILCKMLEKLLWNSFLLNLVVEILQLVHKIEVSPRRSIKEVFWKTSQNSHINTRGSHPKVSCQKTFLKILQNSRKNIFSRFSFLIKLQAGNLKLSEAATGDVLENKVLLKISQISRETACAGVSF